MTRIRHRMLLLLLLLPSGLMVPLATQAACTHYASPTGGGTGLSQGSPMTVQSWLRHARSGEILCLLDGVYRGADSMIDDSRAPRQHLTIRAVNDGKVLLDGEFQRRPVSLSGSGYHLDGLNLTRGSDHNLAVRGEHNTVRRFVAWDIAGLQSASVTLGGHHNVLEDGAGFGASRKQLAAGTGTQGPGHNTIRRYWGRWETKSAPGGSGPTETFEQGYGQEAVTAENIVVTREVAQGAHVTEPEAPLKSFRSSRSRLIGSMAYVTSSAPFDTGKLIHVYADGGSHAQRGDAKPTSHSLFRGLVAYIPPTHRRFAEVAPFAIGGEGGTENTVENIVGVGGQPGACGGSGWQCRQVRSGQSLREVLGAQSVWEAVPDVCYRVVDGQRTAQPLWPWPMNQRIMEALRHAGRSPVDVTATIQELLGPIPAQCRDGGGSGQGPDGERIPAPRHLRILSGQ